MEMMRKVDSIESDNFHKYEPFVWASVGTAGVGKSALAPILDIWLMNQMNWPVTLYPKSFTDKYASDYTKQTCVNIDDFGQMRELSAAMIGEFICWKSPNAFPLNFAAVLDKGGKFASKMISMSTNDPWPDLENSPHAQLTTNAAMWRRRDALIFVKVKPEFQKEDGLLDTSKVIELSEDQQSKFEPHLYFFTDPNKKMRLEDIYSEQNQGWIGYEEMRQRLLEMLKKHDEGQQSYDRMMQRAKDQREPAADDVVAPVQRRRKYTAIAKQAVKKLTPGFVIAEITRRVLSADPGTLDDKLEVECYKAADGDEQEAKEIARTVKAELERTSSLRLAANALKTAIAELPTWYDALAKFVKENAFYVALMTAVGVAYAGYLMYDKVTGFFDREAEAADQVQKFFYKKVGVEPHAGDVRKLVQRNQVLISGLRPNGSQSTQHGLGVYEQTMLVNEHWIDSVDLDQEVILEIPALETGYSLPSGCLTYESIPGKDMVLLQLPSSIPSFRDIRHHFPSEVDKDYLMSATAEHHTLSQERTIQTVDVRHHTKPVSYTSANGKTYSTSDYFISKGFVADGESGSCLVNYCGRVKGKICGFLFGGDDRKQLGFFETIFKEQLGGPPKKKPQVKEAVVEEQDDPVEQPVEEQKSEEQEELPFVHQAIGTSPALGFPVLQQEPVIMQAARFFGIGVKPSVQPKCKDRVGLKGPNG